MTHDSFAFRSNPFRLALVPLLIAAQALSGCGGGHDDGPPISGPVIVQGHIDERLIGTWQVLGEGAVLSVESGRLTQYQQGATLCYRDAAASTDEPTDLDSQQFKQLRGTGPTRIELSEFAGGPVASTLERLAALPALCGQPVQADAASALKALCELVGQDYPFFRQRGVDWAARCQGLSAKAAAAGRGPEPTQALLVEALRGLGDPHVKLYYQARADEERTPVFSAGVAATARFLEDAFHSQSEIDDFKTFQLAWRDTLEAQIDAELTDASGPQLGGALRWGRLPGNVGYLNLYRMIRFADGDDGSDPTREVQLAGAAIDRALAALADTKALIVDVSLNGGGLDVVSAEIAARFADQRRLVMTKRWQRMEGRPPQDWTIEPRGPLQYRKPVFLLTSDLTGSAAETFTLMMRAWPQVTHAGQATAGALSDILDKPLPGGFSVTFTNEIDLAPDGQLFEVSGIPPRLSLPVFGPPSEEALMNGHASAVRALRDLAIR